MTTKPRVDVVGNEHAIIVSTEGWTHVLEARDWEIRAIPPKSVDGPYEIEMVFRGPSFSSHSRGPIA
ncbi:hypothetical protein [Nocardia sp. NPDC127526]|uniref:hypothetical protein n=1 Tax=Nocardia sp. NPDC127526 TaxID=3345393 RepID=UPI00363198F2